jgi:hypothetical protein
MKKLNLTESEKQRILGLHQINEDSKSFKLNEDSSNFDSSLNQLSGLANTLQSLGQSLKNSKSKEGETTEQAVSTSTDPSAIKATIGINLYLVGQSVKSITDNLKTMVYSNEIGTRASSGTEVTTKLTRILELLEGVAKEVQKL